MSKTTYTMLPEMSWADAATYMAECCKMPNTKVRSKCCNAELSTASETAGEPPHTFTYKVCSKCSERY